ncbi:tol-pal system YbgF family protein [Altererythrobacter lutimaris]|nr:hypothetical protein [Altererythrobacter lutimaris]
MPLPIIRPLMALSAAAIVVTTPIPAIAQDDMSEARIRKMEAEIRALQRRVFPGGDGRFFEPEISTVDPSRPTVTTPSTTAVTDILVRLDAMEAQLQQLTGQTEENANLLVQMETRLAALEAGGTTDTPSQMGPDPFPEMVPQSEEPTAADNNLDAMTGGASRVVRIETPPEAAQPSGPSDDRLAAVQEITKPQTGDDGDDEYTYGFRLWDAGFYPEAQQQLSSFVERFPSHWRTSYGRNLLGRAYLDDGKAREAAPWFLRNYQTDKQGIRAGDSLLFLAESMIALEDTNRACIALAEFGETYPALATGRLMQQYEANRARVNCS